MLEHPVSPVRSPAGSVSPSASQSAAGPGASGPESTVVMPDGTQRIPLGSGVITAFLGQGGMANVYEIWNGHLEVYRAVKLINPNCGRDARERFQTEMKITAKLHHPNITEIYGVGTWNGLPYIEMEKLDGTTLDTLIRQRGALPPVVCTAIGIMIARALKYAHSQEYALYGTSYKGVIHRDLKPSNIMICRNGTVKLMDFGIASPAEASFHTVAGTVLGTLQYLPPEQLEGKKLDITADIYSLGVSLYEALTGTMAFAEQSVHKLMLDKLKGRYKPLDEYRLNVPGRLRRLISRSMQQDPRRRVRSAAELLKELCRIYESLTSDTPEKVMRTVLETPSGKRVVVGTRMVWPVRLAAAAAAAVAVGVTVWRLMPEQPAPDTPHRQAPDTVTASLSVSPQAPETVTVVVAPVARGRLTPVSRPSLSPATRPVGVASAEPAAPATSKSPLEIALEKHGTSDPLEAMRRELRSGAHVSALALFDCLPPDRQATVEAQLYRIRALAGAGLTAQLRQALDEREIADGEYLLAKAWQAYEQGRVSEALELLNRADGLPRRLMDYDEYKRESGYCRARCATAQFDAEPGEETYKVALDAWYQLRLTVRATPEHPYHAIVQAEIQRIGQKRREVAGGRG